MAKSNHPSRDSGKRSVTPVLVSGKANASDLVARRLLALAIPFRLPRDVGKKLWREACVTARQKAPTPWPYLKEKST